MSNKTTFEEKQKNIQEMKTLVNDMTAVERTLIAQETEKDLGENSQIFLEEQQKKIKEILDYEQKCKKKRSMRKKTISAVAGFALILCALNYQSVTNVAERLENVVVQYTRGNTSTGESNIVSGEEDNHPSTKKDENPNENETEDGENRSINKENSKRNQAKKTEENKELNGQDTESADRQEESQNTSNKITENEEKKIHNKIRYLSLVTTTGFSQTQSIANLEEYQWERIGTQKIWMDGVGTLDLIQFAYASPNYFELWDVKENTYYGSFRTKTNWNNPGENHSILLSQQNIDEDETTDLVMMQIEKEKDETTITIECLINTKESLETQTIAEKQSIVYTTTDKIPENEMLRVAVKNQRISLVYPDEDLKILTYISSYDGGVSWEKVQGVALENNATGSTEKLQHWECANGNAVVAYARGKEFSLYMVSDENWTELSQTSLPGTYVCGEMEDGERGAIVVEKEEGTPMLLETQDGGKTWETCALEKEGETILRVENMWRNVRTKGYDVAVEMEVEGERVLARIPMYSTEKDDSTNATHGNQEKEQSVDDTNGNGYTKE